MVELRLVPDIWARCDHDTENWKAKPGDEGFGKYYGYGEEEKAAGLLFICPGCLNLTSVSFLKLGQHPSWHWNGNRERPTLTPSIHHDRAKGGCGWHGHLTEGVFTPC